MNTRPPINYQVKSKEEVILAYILREYYAGIGSLSECFNYYKKTGKYPIQEVIDFISHTTHLATQLQIYNSKFAKKVIEILETKNMKESFNKSYSLFKNIQELMKTKGLLKVSGGFRVNDKNKAESIALGMG